MTVADWIDGYRRAWEERDSDAATKLFSDNAVYRDDPFGEPYLGRDGVHAYWQNVTATQADVRARFGEAIAQADGRRAAVEFWVDMLNSDTPITLAGILFLRFDESGLCEELREAWHVGEGRTDPPRGWGS
jgi:hypothetical protein